GAPTAGRSRYVNTTALTVRRSWVSPGRWRLRKQRHSWLSWRTVGKKQGIHGFRAFLIIVGAGTAAGLLVVWLVSLIFKTLVSVASEGLVGSEDSGGGYASPARRPVSSLEPG